MTINQILSYVTIGLLAVFLVGGFVFNNITVQPPEVQQPAVEEQVETASTTSKTGQIVKNGTFDKVEDLNDQAENPNSWWLWQASDYDISPAKAVAKIENGNALIKVINPGGETWHIQFDQWINLERKAKYEISFKVKADISRIIFVKVLQNHDPYTIYFEQKINLTQEWQTFTFEFTLPPDADEVVNLSFELGLDKPTTIYLDDVNIIKE
ncbi:MAG: carbohydrate binding domain-containing protein [Thermosipho sp. (in: Bacteria)]|nr:carbohydrate binding domain-containing protein [Thermosipho sp. (in: thermotogales)]